MKGFLLIAVYFMLCGTLVQSQEVSGFWKGTLTMTGGCFPVNNIELQIHENRGTLTGDSYHYLDIDNFVKKKFQGRYDAAQKKLVLSEGLVTVFNIPKHCTVCIKNYTLVWRRSGNEETLTGEWNGKLKDSTLECYPGTIVLHRIKESAFKEVPEVLVDTGTLRLDFYDNGSVDGDSITVLVNKQVLLSHQRLTVKPITSYLKIDQRNTFQEIEMVAENLGSIPPNTALLIITAGEKRFRLFLSSTEAKSARVRFVYEKASAKPL